MLSVKNKLIWSWVIIYWAAKNPYKKWWINILSSIWCGCIDYLHIFALTLCMSSPSIRLWLRATRFFFFKLSVDLTVEWIQRRNTLMFDEGFCFCSVAHLAAMKVIYFPSVAGRRHKNHINQKHIVLAVFFFNFILEQREDRLHSFFAFLFIFSCLHE